MASHIDYNVSFLSKRLRLIPVMGFHAKAMFEVLADEKLYEYTGGSPPRSVADLEQWFTALESRKSIEEDELWLTWLIFAAEGHTATGYVQATVRGTQAELSWLVGCKWQGLGYATEATAMLTTWLAASAVDSITAHIHSNHLRSQLVAKAVGLNNSGHIEDGEEVWLNRRY